MLTSVYLFRDYQITGSDGDVVLLMISTKSVKRTYAKRKSFTSIPNTRSLTLTIKTDLTFMRYIMRTVDKEILSLTRFIDGKRSKWKQLVNYMTTLSD